MQIRQISHSGKSSKINYHSFEELLNYNNLHTMLNEVKHRYCGLLAIIIEDMVNANPESRLQMEELFDELLKKNE